MSGTKSRLNGRSRLAGTSQAMLLIDVITRPGKKDRPPWPWLIFQAEALLNPFLPPESHGVLVNAKDLGRRRAWHVRGLGEHQSQPSPTGNHIRRVTLPQYFTSFSELARGELWTIPWLGSPRHVSPSLGESYVARLYSLSAPRPQALRKTRQLLMNAGT